MSTKQHGATARAPASPARRGPAAVRLADLQAGDVTAIELAGERAGQSERLHELLAESRQGDSQARITAIRTLVEDAYGEYLLEHTRRDDPHRCSVRPRRITILIDVEDASATDTLRLDAELAFASTDRDRHDSERIRPLVTTRSSLQADDVAQALQAAYPCPVPDPGRHAAMLSIAKKATTPQPRTPGRCAATIVLTRDHELREWRADADASVDGPVISQATAVEHGKDPKATARSALESALTQALRAAQKKLRNQPARAVPRSGAER